MKTKLKALICLGLTLGSIVSVALASGSKAWADWDDWGPRGGYGYGRPHPHCGGYAYRSHAYNGGGLLNQMLGPQIYGRRSAYGYGRPAYWGGYGNRYVSSWGGPPRGNAWGYYNHHRRHWDRDDW